MKAICRECLWTGEDVVVRCPSCGSPRVVCDPELDQLSIAHLDCDAFYASVEKRDRPELRDRPVIVGGGVRGVVSTCCYIARQSGVHSAMPMFKALKACPDAVVLKPDFSKYVPESERIFRFVGELTPLVQTLSLDEAWIDLSGTERLNGGPPALQLIRLQKRIEDETGLGVSIGLAPNRFLAKIASELDKPRGFSVIGTANARALLAPRSVRILPGVGPVFGKTLVSDGLATVGDGGPMSVSGGRLLISRISLPRSRCAAGSASAITNRRSWSACKPVITPTGNPAGKRPPMPEVINRSPSRMSALWGILGSTSRSLWPVP